MGPQTLTLLLALLLALRATPGGPPGGPGPEGVRNLVAGWIGYFGEGLEVGA